MVGNKVGAPGMRRAVISKVAVGNRCGQRSRSVSGDDVALVVTDVEGALRCAAQHCARMQDRQRGRLGLRRGVAADYASGARAESKGCDERIGEARPLVGDNAPCDALNFKRIEQCGDAVEECRQFAQASAVDFKKAVGQSLIVVICRRDAKTRTEQAADTARSMWAQSGKRLLRSTFRIRLKRASDKTTPCACGIAPPDNPVPAPRATTGTPSWWQVRNTSITCPSVSGRQTASGSSR